MDLQCHQYHAFSAVIAAQARIHLGLCAKRKRDGRFRERDVPGTLRSQVGTKP